MGSRHPLVYGLLVREGLPFLGRVRQPVACVLLVGVFGLLRMAVCRGVSGATFVPFDNRTHAVVFISVALGREYSIVRVYMSAIAVILFREFG